MILPIKDKKDKLERLIKMVEQTLREQLKREPTVKEVIDKLPLFLDNRGDRE